MLIFGLRSTSDDQPSDQSDESWPKCNKRPPKSSKMKCSFLDYVQLLMIGQAIWAIWAMKVDKNAPLKCLRMTWNGQFYPIHNFSNLFPPKWLRITQNSQFCLICNFSNLFPPKWLRQPLRMTQNCQFCMAKKKNTMIQGNFYERLHFYMDSCAISPSASLLSNIQSHKHYNSNNIHQKYSINFCCINKISN